MIVLANEKSDRSGGRDQNRNYGYTREFQLYTDDSTNGAGTIQDYIQTNLANWGDPFEELNSELEVVYTDPNSVLVDIKVRQNNRDDYSDWSAILTYFGVEDPTAQPADITIDGVKWQTFEIVDYHDNPVQNSAGDPYPDGLKRDRTRYNITIVKNVVSYDPQLAADYTDSLNTYPLFANPDQGLLPGWTVGGFPVGTVKLSFLTAKRIQRTNQQTFYWQRRAFLEVDLNGWNVKYRDQGYRQIGTDDKRNYSVHPGTGIVQNVVHLLDGTGKFLPNNGTPVIFPTDGFFPYPDDVDWTPLQIDVLI